MLYLVATPIGNLADMSYRAVETLRSCDYILCEDTRHSHVLLKHYGIEKPLKSYHQFNEKKREDEVLEDLESGKTIALISDAGTPGISDPGHQLVRACFERQIKVSAIPGACALVLALTSSSFSTERFQFVGFLPKTLSERKRCLVDLLHYRGTSICYESPHRLLETLEDLAALDPQRRIGVQRELTKLHEEGLEGTAQALSAHFQKMPPRGEIVLLIEGDVSVTDYSALTPQEHVQQLQETYGLSLKDAIKLAAELRDVPKRLIYNALIQP
jgi:16S rRNA (cytidine1402-2'-O)-methyltransferase